MDIQNQSFNRALRGYDPDEVRTFLRRVAQEWGNLLDDRHALRQKVEQLTSELNRYKEMEALLQRTLLQAEENSRITLQNAEKNAALILQEARQKAEEVLANLQRKKEEIEQSIQALQQRKQDILLELRSFLTLQLEKLDQFTKSPLTPSPAPSSSMFSSPSYSKEVSWVAKIAEKI
ncbi:MAG: DivIVA domain-containing protein [Bacteroidia bacterium]|nr:DivIVA domain-containing protein [Bacteroidia bacterium]MDW8134250.1 DivIVA domain-containing protein [Bacteroidia bacterium]